MTKLLEFEAPPSAGTGLSRIRTAMKVGSENIIFTARSFVSISERYWPISYTSPRGFVSYHVISWFLSLYWYMLSIISSLSLKLPNFRIWWLDRDFWHNRRCCWWNPIVSHWPSLLSVTEFRICHTKKNVFVQVTSNFVQLEYPRVHLARLRRRFFKALHAYYVREAIS